MQIIRDYKDIVIMKIVNDIKKSLYIVKQACDKNNENTLSTFR